MGGVPLGGASSSSASRDRLPGNWGMDWICGFCKEKNFAKRQECFKCRIGRPLNAERVYSSNQDAPPDGTTMHGMVKSYNKKGFGFLCVPGQLAQDVYYLRENVSSRLLHPDMPGESVSFEIYREGYKLIAKNIRRFGEDLAGSKANGFGRYNGTLCSGPNGRPSRPDEDREGRWKCADCGERNFMKRIQCFVCLKPRPEGTRSGVSDNARAKDAPPRRTVSPHAGARAIREQLAGSVKKRSSSSASADSAKRKQPPSSSSDSSSSSKKKKKKRRKR